MNKRELPANIYRCKDFVNLAADSALAAAVLAFMAFMVPPNLVLTVACALYRKRRAG